MTTEKKNENIYFNFIFFFTAIIISIIIPLIFKLNRGSFFIGFMISILIINFSFTFFKNYFFNESWYSDEYNYNNATIFKNTFYNIWLDIKDLFGFLFRKKN